MPAASRWLDSYGTPVRTFGGAWPAHWRDRAFALGVAATILFSGRRYEVIYFLMQGLHLALGLPVAQALGKPVVMKFSGSSIITMMKDSWLGRLELRLLQRWARRVMVLNDGMIEEAVAAGFDRAQLAWMPNPVDTDDFCPVPPEENQRLRAQLDIPAGAQVVVYVGRLAPEKELRSLLGAFRQVLDRHPGALLILVGDGPDGPSLHSRAAESGIAANVRFTGRVAIPVVREWLQCADVFTLVSSNEGLPCSLIEAMSVSLPSVVSNIPANAQLVQDGVHGLVVPLRDENAIAAALNKLLDNPASRARLGAAARQRILKNYSTDHVTSRYEMLFADILGQARFSTSAGGQA
jgi:glycosyltransferase involved in cell wall biosynthesis